MISMAYAPESGSEETRKLIKKKMKSDKMFESMRSAVGAGLNVQVFLVVGFPHDTEDQLRENLPFLDEIADIGITDVAVGFYMALPGTQIFDSLYDSGQIRLDRTYFRHILANTAPISTSTYCRELSNSQLTVWKFRLLRRFYSRQRRLADSSGLTGTIREAARSLRSEGADQSKLQTAFRNGVESFVLTARTKLQRGWMPRHDEEAFFASWDELYRDIRDRQLTDGVREAAPADTAELWQHNVIKSLRTTHGTRRSIPVLVR
jgi:hypothetical protein